MSIQELRKGYKQTEVGVIPEDWDIKLLDELTDVIDPHPSHRAPIEVANGVPFLGIGDFNENGEIIKKTYRVVPSIIFQEHQKRYNLNDELLGLGRVASIGKVIKFRNDIGQFTVSPTMGVLKPKIAKRDYLFQILKSQQTTQYFTKIMSGSTRSSVGMIVLRKIPIPIPKEYAEQTAIATALSDADAYIQSLEKLIEKKRNIKQGAMQELLKPKKGWLVKKLGEVVKYTNGTAHENNVVENGKYIIVNSKYISSDAEVAKYSNLQLCPVLKNDILMVLSDVPNGKAIAKCLIVDEDDKYTLNQRICAIRTSELNPKFLFYLLNRNSYFLSFDDGAKQTNLRNIDVLNCPISFPQIEIQNEIAIILSEMHNELNLLENKLSKAKQIKQGMMQELLTGKIRLV